MRGDLEGIYKTLWGQGIKAGQKIVNMKNFNKIDFSKLSIERIELISFIAGIKPALFYPVNDNEPELIEKIFRNICSEQKFYFFKSPVMVVGGVRGPILKNKTQKWLAISRKKKVAMGIIEALKNYKYERLGKLLGYPECCTKRYMHERFYKLGKNNRVPQNISIQDVLKRTMGKLAYYCNNVYNFSGRLTAKDAKNFKKLGTINKKTPYQAYLIFYTPCSYDCKKSIKIGREALKALKYYDPVTADETEKILKKPVLFFNDFQWIVFDGVAEKNHTIFYQSISPPKSLINKNVLKRIERGDKLSLEKKKLVLFRKDKIIDAVNFKNLEPVILNFQ